MAAVSLARGWSGETARPSHAYPPSCAKIAIEPSTANQVQQKAASPNESYRDLSSELSAIEAK
jgi:hypothetical protein